MSFRFTDVFERLQRALCVTMSILFDNPNTYVLIIKLLNISFTEIFGRLQRTV